VIDGILGIDVSKNTLDVSISSCGKVRTKSFANTSDGWHHLLDWLVAQKIRRVHACLESTGRYSLGIACALYEAGHIVSIINPAQVRDFVRTKLGRNKTDGIDASRIREYCELFKPLPWAPPSEAHRRLGELQTIRSGMGLRAGAWSLRAAKWISRLTCKTLTSGSISTISLWASASPAERT
jgi:transposase